MNDQIVDYVEVVRDGNEKYRVRGRADNGEIVWTSEQYNTLDWAQKIAQDSGKEVREYSEPIEETASETQGESETTEAQ